MALSRKNIEALTPAALVTAALLWFDVEWCLQTTFTALSYAETWVSAMLCGLLLGLPGSLLGRRHLQAVLITLLCLWLEANLMYARTYFTAVPLSSYALVGNLADFTASVTDSLRVPDAVFVLIALASWVILPSHRPSQRFRRVYLASTAILAIVLAAMIALRGGYMKAWASLEDANHHSCRTPMYTPFGWLAFDALSHRAKPTQAQIDELLKWLDKRAPLDDRGGRRPRHIVLVLCESLESWPVELSLEGRDVMPNLKTLVADSAVFYAPRIVSQVGAGRSIDAQLLVNAGLLPMLTGVYATSHADNLYHTLTKAIGGRSILLTVDKPVTWNQQGVARAFGIDSIAGRDCWANDEPVGPRRKVGDRSFMRQIARRLDNGLFDDVAFLQIVTYSGHNPFELPDSLNTLGLRGDYDPLTARYLAMAHYTDEALGILLEAIARRPDADDWMTIIPGDHEGLADRRTQAAARHSFVSAEPLVPLIVIGGNADGHRREYGGQIDIFPTLLEMAALQGYTWTGLGTSLLSPAHPGAAVGSDGTLYGAASASDSIRLKDARCISDMIISGDLLRSLNPSAD